MIIENDFYDTIEIVFYRAELCNVKERGGYNEKIKAIPQRSLSFSLPHDIDRGGSGCVEFDFVHAGYQKRYCLSAKGVEGAAGQYEIRVSLDSDTGQPDPGDRRISAGVRIFGTGRFSSGVV